MQETKVSKLYTFSTWGYSYTPNEKTIDSTETQVISSDSHRSGSENPRWKSQVLLGQDATTGFSADRIYISKALPFYWFASRKSPVGYLYINRREGFLPASLPSNPALLDSSVADNFARRKAVDKIFDFRSSFQGATVLAEITDTLRMLRHPANALRNGLDSYHSVAKKRLKAEKSKPSAQKALAGTWLEFQFGWKPLISDIENAVSNLNRHQFALMKFRASGSSFSKTVGDLASLCCTTVSHKYRLVIENKVTVTLRGAVHVDLPYSFLESWGFGTQDFVPAVWEAIPYSFAVDYFTNIGDIIRAYSALASQVSWCNKTVRKMITNRNIGSSLDTSLFFTALFPEKLLVVDGLGETATVRKSVLRSTVSSDSLVPSFQVRLPGTGSLKWLNLAALARLKTL